MDALQMEQMLALLKELESSISNAELNVACNTTDEIDENMAHNLFSSINTRIEHLSGILYNLENETYLS